MKYTRDQFTNEYYQLWQMGLLLPTPQNASIYSVKYRKNHFDEYSRVTLKAVRVSDALERACYAITYASPWRPEDIDLHAVYDEEDNLLWIDESFYNFVQKKNEFRGMERREFLAKFGTTSAAILFGLRPLQALASTTTATLSGTASGFSGEQLYTSSGSYNWTVPVGVTSVCVVCVGGGGGGAGSSGGGGGGGALAYRNSISTTPGASNTISAGAAGLGYYESSGSITNGGNSTAFSCQAGGGASGSTRTGGSPSGVYSNGNAGGNGGTIKGGGGGAGGYSGNGGNGGTEYTNGSAGTGGNYGGGGTGGSGYGGTGNNGGSGAVRIIWGAGRSFPSNAT